MPLTDRRNSIPNARSDLEKGHCEPGGAGTTGVLRRLVMGASPMRSPMRKLWQQFLPNRQKRAKIP
jgi:hypothetical protein